MRKRTVSELAFMSTMTGLACAVASGVSTPSSTKPSKVFAKIEGRHMIISVVLANGEHLRYFKKLGRRSDDPAKHFETAKMPVVPATVPSIWQTLEIDVI